jgi:hypothetical protein
LTSFKAFSLKKEGFLKQELKQNHHWNYISFRREKKQCPSERFEREEISIPIALNLIQN